MVDDLIRIEMQEQQIDSEIAILEKELKELKL